MSQPLVWPQALTLLMLIGAMVAACMATSSRDCSTDGGEHKGSCDYLGARYLRRLAYCRGAY